MWKIEAPQMPTISNATVRMALLAIVCAGLTSCSWRDDLDGERQRPKGASAQTNAVGHQALGMDEHVAIDLFALRPLISVHRQGTLIIDVGSPDFIKYIDGGGHGDWLRGASVSGVGTEQAEAASVVRGLAAEIHFPADKDLGGLEPLGESVSIQFRARPAVANQLVSVFLNEKKLGDIRMPDMSWQTHSISANKDYLMSGENTLRLYFRSTGKLAGISSAAAFSHFSIGGSKGGASGFGVAGFEVSGFEVMQAERSLRVHEASRLSYYVHLPAQPTRLRVTVSAGKSASIRVRDSAAVGSETLWQGTTDTVALDLTRYRGRVVRLDLLSEGDAYWKNPRLILTPPVPHSSPPVLPRAQRILYWSVSSLRSDRLVGSPGTGFQRFVESAFVVPEMQATVPVASAANASLMLGRFHAKTSIEASSETLAEKLQAHGFATALFSGSGAVHEEAGFAQGFGQYDNPMRRQHHAGAKTLWRQAKKFLVKHKDERSFVHISTVEAHLPYRPGAAALEKHWHLPLPFAPSKSLGFAAQIEAGRRVPTENEKAYIRALYNAALSEADEAFSAMLEDLTELDLPGNTVVVLVGEHGEQLWERGSYGHGASLFQESLSTPIAIAGEGVQALVPPSQASAVDLAPTILQLAGLPHDPSMQGRGMLGNTKYSEIRPIFSGLLDGSRALRLGRYKLLRIGGSISLYDLEADAAERLNIAGQNPIATRALRNTLSFFSAFEQRWSTARWGHPSNPSEAFAADLGM